MENIKEIRRKKRHKRIRNKLYGTQEKPRLVIHRSLNNIFAQVIDDTQSKTLLSLSTLDKAIKQKNKTSGNLKTAAEFGEIFAKAAKEKGIAKVVFDRAGYLFHGRVKVFADSVRKNGLEF